MLNDETRVAVAGDWHGDSAWARRAIAAVRAADPDVRSIFHVGDFWGDAAMLRAVDEACAEHSIRIYLTVGNHEPFPKYPMGKTEPYPLSDSVTLLPRPWRGEVGGLSFVSLGGASSVDRLWRVAGREWWTDESITEQMRDDAIAFGDADVLITHEPPSNGTRAVREILSGNPFGYPILTLSESADSRARVQAVSDALRPRLHFHGHMHAPDTGNPETGLTVVSLGMNEQEMNVVILDCATKMFTTVRV